MGIGENHPLRGDLIHSPRVDFRLAVQTGKVAVPHVVGKDVDDVGLARIALCGHSELLLVL
jgi:hypothetical protein